MSDPNDRRKFLVKEVDPTDYLSTLTKDQINACWDYSNSLNKYVLCNLIMEIPKFKDLECANLFTCLSLIGESDEVGDFSDLCSL